MLAHAAGTGASAGGGGGLRVRHGAVCVGELRVRVLSGSCPPESQWIPAPPRERQRERERDRERDSGDEWVSGGEGGGRR